MIHFASWTTFWICFNMFTIFRYACIWQWLIAVYECHCALNVIAITSKRAVVEQRFKRASHDYKVKRLLASKPVDSLTWNKMFVTLLVYILGFGNVASQNYSTGLVSQECLECICQVTYKFMTCSKSLPIRLVNLIYMYTLRC